MSTERTVAFEVERVQNLLRGFGWNKTKEAIVGGKVVLEFEKEMEVVEKMGLTEEPG